MTSHEVSRTALAVAYMRAAHQILDSNHLLFEDALAVPILGKGALRKIREATARYHAPDARALRSRIALRSRYAEDQLLSAIQRGISQYVIVGAGFDTFSLRQPKWANDLLIVEVDHTATQGHKLSLIAEAGLSVRDNVKFAQIDFESETLEDGLLRNGISSARNTFFSWLGVTMYLTREAIDATLLSMSQFPVGSQVVLTFAEPPTSSPVVKAIAARVAEHVESIGEPFLSYFEPEAVRAMLVAAGFASVELLSADEAHKRYFVDGHMDLPLPKRIGLASAIR